MLRCTRVVRYVAVSSGGAGSGALLRSRGLCVTLRRADFAVRLPMLAAVGATVTQRRTQFVPMPGKREQEAFLAQYDPMDVLGIDPDCTVEDIDKAFETRKTQYGPNGSTPNAKLLDRAFRAHEILKDPNSPYYLRAHSSQTERQRLQFQLLPKSKRRIIEFQVGVLMSLLLGIGILVIILCLRPIKRSMRAATR